MRQTYGAQIARAKTREEEDALGFWIRSATSGTRLVAWPTLQSRARVEVGFCSARSVVVMRAPLSHASVGVHLLEQDVPTRSVLGGYGGRPSGVPVIP
jgi:hypothetical protein